MAGLFLLISAFGFPARCGGSFAPLEFYYFCGFGIGVPNVTAARSNNSFKPNPLRGSA
jgi:hypothetical protein